MKQLFILGNLLQIIMQTSSRQSNSLICEYVLQSTSMHKKRLDSLLQANKIAQKQYKSVEEEIGMIKEDSYTLNHDIDAFISTFGIIDEIQDSIQKTEDNIDLVQRTIAKLIKKVSQLKKNRKK